MARGGRGLPKVLSCPPCPPFQRLGVGPGFQGLPAHKATGLRLSSTHLNTPRRTPIDSAELKARQPPQQQISKNRLSLFENSEGSQRGSGRVILRTNRDNNWSHSSLLPQSLWLMGGTPLHDLLDRRATAVYFGLIMHWNFQSIAVVSKTTDFDPEWIES
jgi:hypothetical protein